MTGSRRPSRHVLGFVGAGLLGIGVFSFCFGWKIVSFRQVDWLLSRDDPAMFYLGWLFYRHEPWSFPLGVFHDYFWPFGGSVAITDSIPLLAMPLKLASGWLGEPFQYFGLWILISCFLQAAFGYLLTSALSSRTWFRLAGTSLLAASPVMLQRQGGHIALSSHWILLAGLWLYFRDLDPARAASTHGAPGARPQGPVLRPWLILCAVAALVHPYLTVMLLGIALAYAVRIHFAEKRLGRIASAGFVVAQAAATGGLWWVAGYFCYGSGASSAAGFGHYSMNLNALINPLGTSTFLKDLPRATIGQYEGYNYLGAGLLLLVLYALCLVFARRTRRRTLAWLAPLVVVGALMATFALSNRITWSQHTVMSYKLPGTLAELGETFRSSGRFFWVPYYTGIALALLLISRRANPRVAAALLAAGLAIQVADVGPAFDHRADYRAMQFRTRLASPVWDQIVSRVDRLLTFPPLEYSTQYKSDFRDIAACAARYRKPVSVGYVGRLPANSGDYLAEMDRNIRASRLDDRAAYILKDWYFTDVYRLLPPSFQCTELDGYKVCYPLTLAQVVPQHYVSRDGDLASYLRESGDQTLVLAVRDEATTSLADADRQALAATGARIADLQYRGSYAAVIDRGRVVAEQLDNHGPVRIELPAGFAMNGSILQQPIVVTSAGFDAGNDSSILVGGRRQGLNHRGFNIVRLDDRQEVSEVASFDTCAGGPGLVLRLVER